MNSKYKYLLKNTGILTISNFSSKILVFLLVPLYTSILTTNEYGIYDLVSSTVQLSMPIITLNIYDAVMRYLMDNGNDKKQVISIGLKFNLIGILTFGLLLLLNNYFKVATVFIGYEIFAFLLFTFSLLNQFLIQVAKGLEKVKDMAVAGVIGTVSVIFFNLLFLLIFKMKLLGFFSAYILGQFIPVAYLSYKLSIFRYITFRCENSLQKDMTNYSVPLIFNTLGWWVNNASDRYIVTWFCGMAANGIYSVSYKIPSILNIVQGIFIQAWQISAFKEYDQKNSAKFYSDALFYINLLMCCVCMFLILLTIPIAKFLYSNDFFEAWKYVPFLLVSSVINAASGVIGPILSAQKKSKALGASAIIGASVNMILNIILIYFIGVQGAAIATLISSFTIYECRKIAICKDITLYNSKKIILSWILLIIQSTLLILYKNYFYQIIVILIILICFVDELKVIFSGIKNMILKSKH